MFGAQEVLVAAKHLIGEGAMRLDPKGKPLVYFHLLLDDHMILKAHGIWTESLFLGDANVDQKGTAAKWNVMADIDQRTIAHATTARPVLAALEAKLLLRMLRPEPLLQAA